MFTTILHHVTIAASRKLPIYKTGHHCFIMTLYSQKSKNNFKEVI